MVFDTDKYIVSMFTGILFQNCTMLERMDLEECIQVMLSKLIRMFLVLQANLIITLSLGSIETGPVISEPCYNEVTFYRHIIYRPIREP